MNYKSLMLFCIATLLIFTSFSTYTNAYTVSSAYLTNGSNNLGQYSLIQNTKDYLKGDYTQGKNLEIGVYLSSQNDAYNNDQRLKGLNSLVKSCNFTIYINSRPYLSVNTSSSDTFGFLTYYFSMKEGDNAFIKSYCDFNNASYYLPTYFYLELPTETCSECRVYQEDQRQKDIYITKTLSTYNTSLVNYIEGFLFLIVDIIYIVFWILVIVLFLFVMGAILSFLLWIYNFIRGHIRK